VLFADVWYSSRQHLNNLKSFETRSNGAPGNQQSKIDRKEVIGMASKEDHYASRYRSDALRLIASEAEQIAQIDEQIERMQLERKEHIMNALTTVLHSEVHSAIVGSPSIKVDDRGFVTVNVKLQL
jgi:hypothetical protein